MKTNTKTLIVFKNLKWSLIKPLTFCLLGVGISTSADTYKIGGMDCGNCVKSIENAVCKMEGVESCTAALIKNEGTKSKKHGMHAKHTHHESHAMHENHGDHSHHASMSMAKSKPPEKDFGTLKITFKDGQKPDEAKLKAAIEKAGYSFEGELKETTKKSSK